MTYYDAISMIRGELFIFRGPVSLKNPFILWKILNIVNPLQFLWRLGENGLYPGYPTETRRHWAALPENLTKVDAVYENKQRQIVFFIGKLIIVFTL